MSEDRVSAYLAAQMARVTTGPQLLDGYLLKVILERLIRIGSFPNFSQSWAPLMLGAVNGNPMISGPPKLVRLGDMVWMTFQGTRTSQTMPSSTISFAWIPEGFRPIGNVMQANAVPAGNWQIQIFNTNPGTNVFAEDPGVNMMENNTRWTLRFSAQIGTGNAVSLSMNWQTADEMVAA